MQSRTVSLAHLGHPRTGALFDSPVKPGTGWPGDPATARTGVAAAQAQVPAMALAAESPAQLDAEVSVCRACPRLVEWREQVALVKRRSFAEQPYWGRPVPGWGAERPRLMIVGLAPAANGANRTGRVFTGDRSGDVLYAAMHRAGLANSPISVDAADGLALNGTRVAAAVRCAPPDNAPTPAERATCAPWLTAEWRRTGWAGSAPAAEVRPRRRGDLAGPPWGGAAAGLLPPQSAEHLYRQADHADAGRRVREGEADGRHSMTTVLVSGASIAGLATTYWLAQQGYSVTVVERHDGPRPGGQAIDVRGPALSILARMNLLEAAEDKKIRIRGASFVDRDGNELSRDTESTPTGGVIDNPDIEILRDDLVDLLLGALDTDVEFLFGDSINGLDDHGDAVAVSFERADIRDFDLVIGADGLHSNVRKLTFAPEEQFIKPLGIYLAIFTVPNFLHLDYWQMFHPTHPPTAGA